LRRYAYAGIWHFLSCWVDPNTRCAAVVIPLARLEAALDGDLLALAEILAAHLRQPIPDHDVVELRAFLSVAAELVGGHRKGGDARAACQRPELRIAGQSAGK
jgi:hypothetical protein